MLDWVTMDDFLQIYKYINIIAKADEYLLSFLKNRIIKSVFFFTQQKCITTCVVCVLQHKLFSSTQVKVDGPVRPRNGPKRARYNGPVMGPFGHGPVTGPFSIHQYIYISKK